MIYLVDLESVESRYTKQWKTHFPTLLENNGLNVTVIDGPSAGIPEATTPGAFLNFGGTNIYKAAQITKISKLFCEGKIKDGDYFLYTDENGDEHFDFVKVKLLEKHGTWEYFDKNRILIKEELYKKGVVIQG